MTYRNKAFTLIELLVVISIVASLASVVLASLNSARDKGRLGAGKYFAAQVDHVAGDQAVGIWDFNECAGTTVSDGSGNGNSGSFSPSPPGWISTNSPSGTGCSLSFTERTNASISAPRSPSRALMPTPSRHG